ncbi:MAG: hypothetical protein EOO38_30310 [Cytophagaceae bacterium]|nr:MAG: hypothetical protein EOO38_30310 [Cytophagaceae bacterium]
MPNNYIDSQPIEKVALTTAKPLPFARIAACYARFAMGDYGVIGCLLPTPRGAKFSDGFSLWGAGLVPVSVEQFKEEGARSPSPLAMRYFDDGGEPYPWILCILPENENECGIAYSLLIEAVQTQKPKHCARLDGKGQMDTWGIDCLTEQEYHDCLWRQQVRNQGIMTN